MWGCLATPHTPITSSENISNITYIYFDLFANLEDWQRPVDTKSMTLGILYLVLNVEYPFSLLRDFILLGMLEYF